MNRTTVRLLFLALALAGCTAAQPHGPASRGPADWPVGTLATHPCQARTATGHAAAECGTLVVERLHGHPASGSLALPFIRFHATGTVRREPVFYLGGGPGESNLGHRPHPAYLEDGDYVVVGYRGVDGSVRLDAPEIRAALLGGDGDLLSPASLEGVRQAAARAAQRFRDEGIDLNHFTVREVIGDLESVRQALGYPRVSLRGVSFGTRVALIYQELHPERIARSVLVAPNPPGGFVWDAKLIDRQLAAWDAARSAGHPPGAMARATPGDMARVLSNLPDRWRGVPLDPGRIRVTSFLLLFDMRTAEALAQAYAAAAEGDYGGLALLSFGYRFILPGRFAWGAMASMGASLDGPDAPPMEPFDGSPAPVLGSPLGDLIWTMAPAMGVDLLPSAYRDLRGSDTPTLLLTGALDFSTPPARVERFLGALPNGHHLVVPDRGHMDVFRGWEEDARERIREFFLDDTPGDAPPSVPPYDVGTSGLLNLPRTARWAFNLSAGVTLLAGALVLRRTLR